MRVFITGASGLVGAAVAKAMIDHGHEVHALVRDEATADRMRASGYTAVRGDIRNSDAWEESAAEADALIHLVFPRAPKRMGKAYLRKAAEVDRAGFEALVRAARAGGQCRAICYTSGISVHGNHGDDWVDEETLPRPGLLGSIKYAGEKRALDAASEGLPAFALRPGLVYAAQGVFADFFLKPAAKGRFDRIGEGRAFHSTIHLHDLAQAFVAAVERPPVGKVLNIVDDVPYRWRDLADLLLGAFGGGKARSAPPWLVSLAGGRALVEILTESYRVRNDRARQMLDWQPTFARLEDGLPSVITAFLDQEVQVSAEFRRGRPVNAAAPR